MISHLLFLFGFINLGLANLVSYLFIFIVWASIILFNGVSGLLAYQIEYRPIIAVIWGAALFLPYVSLIVIVVLFIQAKSYLRKKNYKIGLWGARPISPEDASHL